MPGSLMAISGPLNVRESVGKAAYGRLQSKVLSDKDKMKLGGD